MLDAWLQEAGQARAAGRGRCRWAGLQQLPGRGQLRGGVLPASVFPLEGAHTCHPPPTALDGVPLQQGVTKAPDTPLPDAGAPGSPPLLVAEG